MMKRSRKELKALAKRALLGNYGTVAGAFLLTYLGMFAMSIPMIIIFVIGMFTGLTGSSPAIGAMAGMIIGLGVWYLLILIVSTLFMIGITRICYQLCIGQAGRLGDLLYAFKNRPLRFMGLSLLILFITLLGSIPGIVLMLWGQLVVKGAGGMALYVLGYVLTLILGTAAMLRYFLAIFVLVEEPWRKVGECIRLSREMMEGNKMRLFKLQLSFIGVLLLLYLTFGLGTLWVTPYLISTNICFYLSVKEEKYGYAQEGQETADDPV